MTSPNPAIGSTLKVGWERLRISRYHFLIWRKQRPFAGAVLLLLAGVLVLLGPLSLIRFALLPGSTIWAGVLVGALLLVMGLIQLLAPTYALIAGAIGIVLALVSLLVALGGFVIGMILGIIGGALGVAWRPAVRTAPSLEAWSTPNRRRRDQRNKG